MAKFFINRPIFAIVIAIVITILGGVAIPNLPIATYPEVVPPVVQIIATYRGGNAQDLEKTVAQPIEQQLTGLDGMLYFFSRSSNDGVLTIDVTYELGTNIDLATVKTQNKVNLALPSLPPEVQRVGVTVKKVSSAFLMAIAVTASDNRYDSLFLSNYATINMLDKIGSIPGIGDTRLAATQDYGMRIWINPDKMAKLGLTATDVNRAVQAQNRQNPAGSIGQAPAPRGTDFQYPVTASGRLLDAQQFGDIILRAQSDGSFLRLKDVGRVELGAQDYKSFSELSGKPAAVIIAYLAPGANAVETADRVRHFLAEAEKNFPAGIAQTVSYDATKFVRTAIADVVETLFIAVLLVIFVVYIFLQNWRATLIPLLTVPVAVVGTFALFPILGFTINMTSMFGLVLAIGIVVDDAIVVVEAVQHNIDHGMSPHDATIKAMEEVSGPVIAIAFILAAVFVPVAFLGGISGQIYRQFALTIAASVLISAFSALTLSPALSAMILRPVDRDRKPGPLARFFGLFNRGFEKATNGYLSGVRLFGRRSFFAGVALLALYFCVGGLFRILPGGFLPDEDQGVIFVAVRLPDGASLERTQIVVDKIQSTVGKIPGVENTTVFGGLDLTTQTNNSNVATIILTLTPWEERKSKDLQFASILGKVNGALFPMKESFSFGFGLPPILGLGTAGGFEFLLEDRAGGDVNQLANTANAFLAAASKEPALGQIANTFRVSVPGYQVELNNDKTQALGIPPTDVYDSLQTFLGGLYINDFNRFGRTWRVVMQAEPDFRDRAEDVNRYYVRSATNDMVPLSTLVTMHDTTSPEVIYRYNRFRSAKLIGSAAPGYTSGQAVEAMERVAKEVLPQGFGYEWTGTVYQQKLSEGKEVYIFGFASILVFLFLAAQYESWMIPFAVILAVPLGILGALLAVLARSYAYDVYTQIGIVTLIGLASKNAILIVEFAKLRREEGMSPFDAAVAAAQLRLRPIIMTSFAFILGVVPLVYATGAGAASRRALGTTVFGGMLAATLLAIFFVPMLYVVTETWAERFRKGPALATAMSLLVMFFSSCAVGPNYKRPDLPAPPQFRADNGPVATESIADRKWSTLFEDEVLTELVDTALKQNYDVRIAAERVLQARAQLTAQQANLYPNVTASGNLSANRISQIGQNRFLPRGTNLDVTYTQAGFALSWELDVWGRLRRLNEAARAQYLSTEEARRAVISSLVADVTDAYLSLRELDTELEISKKTKEIAENGLRLTNVRLERGVSTGLDVQQAEQLFRTATSQIVANERAIEQQENALSILLGKNPGPVKRGKRLSELNGPEKIPPGLPSDLLARRPDIRQAEQVLIAANARIGAARAEYFPQITLTGLLGAQARPLLDLFTGAARQWNAAPTATIPIFNAGQLRANVRYSEAAKREMLATYEKTIQTAFREVSDSLVGYRKNAEQMQEQQKLVDALNESSRLSILRYQGGLDSYLQVLDAQRNQFQGELVLAQLRQAELVSVVQLYRALGGGWN
ncbi:multidrug efflux RND transporter permease subunit [Bryobacter aggregatus]|uniref:multidrug efflux RND transporter permease subunit n=1 Tax=Bryobacter aggregatus TaxID=360054 RepID=UPI0009B5A53F|nr:multidrug efflux RND transporter permease subunit [Bryobacter aggregatus]